MSLSPKPVVGKLVFIVMAYIADALGVPRPKKPLMCPRAGIGDIACTIHIARWRFRKCGISFLLAGMRCLTHRISFTVYPPGWAPYSRRPLAAIDHSGCAIEPVDDESQWSDTVFKAAIDAANKRLWPEEVLLGPSPTIEDGVAIQSRRTQHRHIAGVMQLFGFNISATMREREVVASFTGIGVSRLEEGAKKIREGPSLMVRGMETVQILEQL